MDLEKQYSPSRWSKLYSADDAIKNYVSYLTKESDKIRKIIPNNLNNVYGSRENQKYDLFGTHLPEDSPILIYVHGGYWQELSRADNSYIAEAFVKNNVKTIIVGYDLCPDITVSEIVYEIKELCTTIIEYAKHIGCKQLFMMGHSAGAHLIASLFKDYFIYLSVEDNELFKGFFLISGIYDIQPLVKTYVNLPLKLTQEIALELSPYFSNVRILNKHITLFVGEHDSPAFLNQTMMYYTKLKETDNDVFVKVINNVDHFEIVKLLSNENYEIVQSVLKTIKK